MATVVEQAILCSNILKRLLSSPSIDSHVILRKSISLPATSISGTLSNTHTHAHTHTHTHTHMLFQEQTGNHMGNNILNSRPVMAMDSFLHLNKH